MLDVEVMAPASPGALMVEPISLSLSSLCSAVTRAIEVQLSTETFEEFSLSSPFDDDGPTFIWICSEN